MKAREYKKLEAEVGHYYYGGLPNLGKPMKKGGYPRETVVAEKLEAIVKLGLLNTRLKDYYDLHHLSRSFEFDGGLLVRAITATFQRRQTALPMELPVGLTTAFSQDGAKQTQWSAFRRRLGEGNLPDLPGVVDDVKRFASEPLAYAARSEPMTGRWTPQQMWKE